MHRYTRAPSELGHRRHHPRALRFHTPAGEASLGHPRQDHDRTGLRASARGDQRSDRVVVATDDERIATVVRGFGGEVVMTSPDHATGTDRLAEAARSIEADVDRQRAGRRADDRPRRDRRGGGARSSRTRRCPMATLSLPLRSAEEMLAPSVVKVVVDARGDALYFSRSPIPHVRLGARPTLAPPPRRRSPGASRASTSASTRTGARRSCASRRSPPRPSRRPRGSSSSAPCTTA